MFEGIKDMGKLLKQANEMRSKMKTVQDELKTIRVSGSSAGGKVTVELTGELECLSVTIDPSLLSDGSALQKDLVKAINDASKKAKDVAATKLSAVTGGLNLPGM